VHPEKFLRIGPEPASQLHAIWDRTRQRRHSRFFPSQTDARLDSSWSNIVALRGSELSGRIARTQCIDAAHSYTCRTQRGLRVAKIANVCYNMPLLVYAVNYFRGR